MPDFEFKTTLGNLAFACLCGNDTDGMIVVLMKIEMSGLRASNTSD